MTLDELYKEANHKILHLGYQNLDFKHNLGHSIEKELNRRRFIEAGNKTQLKELRFFTFEPHICRPTKKWGFKRENIYYFNDKNQLIEL